MPMLASKPNVNRTEVLKHRGQPARRFVSVVIPTYKEAENLGTLLPTIADVLDSAGLSGEIIVVDDSSADGTEALCHEMHLTVPVRLIVRSGERGLATAVVRGLEEATGDVFVVMDADFSHSPTRIPKLVESLDSCEFAFGSRYVSGASLHDRWNLFRSLNSRIATLLARGLTKVSDPMSGFFALRRDVFDRSRSTLNPTGYKIGLELLVRGRCREVQEIPIHFDERRHGESKLSFDEQIRYIRHLGRLYRTRLFESSILRFGMVGMIGMVVDLTAFSLLLLMASTPIARGAAIALAMLVNYFLNRRFTFAKKSSTSLREFTSYCGVCGIGAMVSWISSLTLIYFQLVPGLLAAGIGVLLGAGANYVGCKHVTFADNSSTLTESDLSCEYQCHQALNHLGGRAAYLSRTDSPVPTK